MGSRQCRDDSDDCSCPTFDVCFIIARTTNVAAWPRHPSFIFIALSRPSRNGANSGPASGRHLLAMNSPTGSAVPNSHDASQSSNSSVAGPASCPTGPLAVRFQIGTLRVDGPRLGTYLGGSGQLPWYTGAQRIQSRP